MVTVFINGLTSLNIMAFGLIISLRGVVSINGVTTGGMMESGARI